MKSGGKLNQNISDGQLGPEREVFGTGYNVVLAHDQKVSGQLPCLAFSPTYRVLEYLILFTGYPNICFSVDWKGK